jgi:hypothetical protein
VCLLLLMMINESIKVSPFSLIYVFCVVHNECVSSSIEFGKFESLVSLLCFGIVQVLDSSSFLFGVNIV